MNIQFKEYIKSTKITINNDYFKKLTQLGFVSNQNLNQISEKDMNNFLNQEYHNILPIIPIQSCSMISGNKILLNKLQKYFKIKTATVYGYIQTKEQTYHKFSDEDIKMSKNKYFDNHHAWIIFENGQLLDLTFINTLKNARNSNIDKFEFILSDASKIAIPESMNLMYKLDNKSIFQYIPMYYGDLFSQEFIFENAKKGICF